MKQVHSYLLERSGDLRSTVGCNTWTRFRDLPLRWLADNTPVVHRHQQQYNYLLLC